MSDSQTHNERAVDTAELFNGNYGLDPDIRTEGPWWDAFAPYLEKSYWWKGGNPLSTVSSDYTAHTVKRFLELIEAGEIVPGGLAIDAGSGEGFDAARNAILGWTVQGYELSKAGVSKSYVLTNLRLTTSEQWRVEFFRRNFLDVPFGAEQFNLVWFRGVLDYLRQEDQEPALKRLQTATKIGGIFMVHTVIDYPIPHDTPQHRKVPLNPDEGAGLTRAMFSEAAGWDCLYSEFEYDKPHDDPVHSHSHFNGIYRKMN